MSSSSPNAKLVSVGPPDVVLYKDRKNHGWPDGWTQRVYQRINSPNGRCDRYWYSPKQTLKLRSVVQVRKFLEVVEQFDGDEEAAFESLYGSIKNSSRGGDTTKAEVVSPEETLEDDENTTFRGSAGGKVDASLSNSSTVDPPDYVVKDGPSAQQNETDCNDDPNKTVQEVTQTCAVSSKSHRDHEESAKQGNAGTPVATGENTDRQQDEGQIQKLNSTNKALKAAVVSPTRGPEGASRKRHSGESKAATEKKNGGTSLQEGTNANPSPKPLVGIAQKDLADGHLVVKDSPVGEKVTENQKRKRASDSPKSKKLKAAPPSPKRGASKLHFEIGTKILKHFPGYGYYWGSITKLAKHKQTGTLTHTVTYDDGDLETFSVDSKSEMQELRRLVRLATRKRQSTESGSKYQSLWDIHDRLRLRKSIPGFEDAFVSNQVADFFLFVYERQLIWERRKKLEKAAGPSFTSNQILGTHRFCNIYRELDRGTAFFHAHIIDLFKKKQWTQKEWTRQVLWVAYVYRLVNRVESFANVGFPALDDGVNQWLDNCSEYMKDHAFFTAAHQTTNLQDYRTGIRRCLQKNMELLEGLVDKLVSAPTLQECHVALTALPNVGKFVAWQILCDLKESSSLPTDNFPDSDTFCELGPGAKAGMSLIFGSDADHEDDLERLVKYQAHVYFALDVTFPCWNGRSLRAKEIEHSLCEYTKFKRLEDDSSQQDNDTSFDPPTRKMRKWVSAADDSSSKSDEIVRQCDTCFGTEKVCSSRLPKHSSTSLCTRCIDFAHMSYSKLPKE